MNLPSYFLADLPNTDLSPVIVREACGTLKNNRARYLAARTTPQIIRTLSNLARDWLDSNSPFRQMALWEGPRHTGFSRPTIERGLDNFFREVTPERLQALIVQDLGHVNRLDEFCSSEQEAKEERASMARGPELIAHIGGGLLPNPMLASIIQGLLVRSAQFVKCPSGASFLPRLFAHSIYESDSKLASCLEIAEWKGGNNLVEAALYEGADCITVTGSDETVQAVRKAAGARPRILPYAHRVSFSYISREVIGGINPARFAQKAARDMIDWNQLGCLSPHVIYVETGGKLSPEKFAELLVAELTGLEQSDPRGEIPTTEAAAIATRRSFYQLRSAAACQTKMWASPDSTAWTVVFEEDPQFQVSCLNRFVYVKSVADPAQAMASADPVRHHISTVGLAASEDRAAEIALQFARWGASRICQLGQMQNPSILWRHDGRPSLADLVTWTDWEHRS